MTDLARRHQIIRLLETRDDHLPMPVRHDHSPAGFIHHTIVRETCTDCLANDRAMPGCETCGGRGYIETERARDPYAVEKVQPYGMTGERHEKRRERDNELARLERQTAPPWTSEQDALADANRHPFAWEIQRQAKWRDYDYHALDLALDDLRLHDQGAYHLTHSVYVYGYVEFSTVVEAAVERGLMFIDQRMPDPIRAPGDQQPELNAAAKDSLRYGKTQEHERRREARVARVLRAHFDWGWSTAEIAAHESLSRRRVQELISAQMGAVASGPAA